MNKWVEDVIASPAKKAIPVLSFPSVQLIGCTVKELVYSSELQAKGMKAIADRVPSGASVCLMDLSVEAEAFGSRIHVSDNEVPTVIGALVEDEESADALAVPKVGAGRTGIYVDTVKKASQLITDRPVLAGAIGPYSLAGRLMDVSEIMILCFEDPDMVHKVLEKATEFVIAYVKAMKEAGADGVVIAEPLAGLISPALAEEFSLPYMKRIINAVQDEEFATIYHNCGNTVTHMAKAIYGIGAKGYHFGDAVDLSVMFEDAPDDVLVMGNVSPSAQFLNGTPDSIKEAVKEAAEKCSVHKNFVMSSGCDIPPQSPWENIDAFFEAVV